MQTSDPPSGASQPLTLERSEDALLPTAPRQKESKRGKHLTKDRKETKEGGFLGRLLAALCKIEGVTVHRQNSGWILIQDRHTGKVRKFLGAPTGACDISGIVCSHGTVVHGKRIEIETKTSKGKIREAQVKWAAHMQKSGALYMYAPMLKRRHVDDSVAYYKLAFEDLIAQFKRGTEK